jgi:hypothetical protein
VVIGLLTLDLRLPEAVHLKAKRSALAPVLAAIRRDWNAAAAEVEHRDAWQRARIAVVTVNTDGANAHRTLTEITDSLERRHGLELLDTRIEML